MLIQYFSKSTESKEGIYSLKQLKPHDIYVIMRSSVGKEVSLLNWAAGEQETQFCKIDCSFKSNSASPVAISHLHLDNIFRDTASSLSI